MEGCIYYIGNQEKRFGKAPPTDVKRMVVETEEGGRTRQFPHLSQPQSTLLKDQFKAVDGDSMWSTHNVHVG